MLAAEASLWPRPYVTVGGGIKSEIKTETGGLGLQGEELGNLQISRCPSDL